MSKLTLAGLLFIAGLGVGLWLGFSPVGRTAVQQNLERATASVAQIKTDVELRVDHLKPRADVATPEEGAPLSAPAAGEALSGQVEKLWKATQQLWFGLLARLEIFS